MTATLDDHTVLPPPASAQLSRLAEAITTRPDRPAYLLGPDDSMLELPAEVYAALRAVVQSLNEGLAITVFPRQTVLTTQEAADLLGMSRPTLVKLLETKEIPFTTVGRHRRVALADLLEYKRHARERAQEALRRMTQEGEAAGLHKVADRPRPTR